MKKNFYDCDGFVEKFKPKKTTDDCYTPQSIYDTVLDWSRKNLKIPADAIIERPFWPGADYTSYNYTPKSIVVDNPPFSILSKIVDYYLANNIHFVLFAPGLTLFCDVCDKPRVTAIVAAGNVTYENGANIMTSFLTDLYPGEPYAVGSHSLFKEIYNVSIKQKNGYVRTPIKHEEHVITSSILAKYAAHNIPFVIPRDEARYVRCYGVNKHKIYGSGYMLSSRLAAERLAAERLLAERLAAEQIKLSISDYEIIKELDSPNKFRQDENV